MLAVTVCGRRGRGVVRGLCEGVGFWWNVHVVYRSCVCVMMSVHKCMCTSVCCIRVMCVLCCCVLYKSYVYYVGVCCVRVMCV